MDSDDFNNMTSQLSFLNDNMESRDQRPEKNILEEAIQIVEDKLCFRFEEAEALRMKNERLGERNLKYIENVSNYEVLVKELDEKVAGLQEDKRELSKELEVEKRLHLKLAEEYSDKKKEFAQAKESVHSKEKQFCEMKQQCAQKYIELQNCDEQIRDLEKEVTDGKYGHQRLSKEVEHLKDRISEQKKTYEDEITVLRVEVAEKKTALRSAVEDSKQLQGLNQESYQKMRDNFDEVQKLSAENNVIKNELSSKDGTIQSLQRKLVMFKKQLEKTEAARSDLKKKLESTRMKYEAEMQEIKFELNANDDALKKFSAKKENLVLKCSGFEDKLRATEDLLQLANAQIEHLTNELVVKQSNDDVTSQMKKKHDQETSELRHKIKKLNDEAAMKEKSALQTSEESRRIQERLQQLHMTHESEQEIRRSELARKTEDLNRMKLKTINLDDKVTSLQDELKKLRGSDTRNKQENVAANRELEERNDEVTKLKAQIQQFTNLATDNKEESEYFKDQLENLRKENSMMEESYKEALKSLSEDKSNRDALLAERDTLQHQKKELMKRLGSRDEMLHKVTLEATRLKDKYRQASGQCGANSGIIRQLEEEVDKWKAEYQIACRDSEEKCLGLERTLNDERRNGEDFQMKLEEVSLKLEEKQQEFERMKASLDEIGAKHQKEVKDLQQLKDHQHKSEMTAACIRQKYKTAQDEVNNVNIELIQLKAELNTVKEHNKVIKEENKTTTEKLASYKTGCEQAEEELTSRLVVLDNQKLEIQRKDGEVKALEEKLKLLAGRSDKQLEAEQQLEEEMKKIKSSYDQQNQELKQQYESLEEGFHLLQNDYNEKLQELDCVYEDNKNMNLQVTNSHQETDCLVDEMRNLEVKLVEEGKVIEKLKRERDEAHEKMREFSLSCDLAHKNLQEVQESGSVRTKDYKEAKKRAEELKDVVGELEKQMKEKDTTIELATFNLNNNQEETLKLREEVKSYSDIISNLTNEIEQLQTEYRTTVRKCDDLTDENKQVSQRAIKNKEQLIKLQEKLCSVQSEAEMFKASHLYSNQEFNDSMLEKRRVEDELEKLSKLIEEQLLEIEVKDKDVADLKDDMLTCEEYVNEKEDELAELNEQLSAARSSIDASQLKITKAVQAEKEKSTLIQRELDDEKAANFELRQAVSECKAEICKMEEQLQTSVNNVENRCNEISQLQSTCKTLQVCIVV